MRVPAPASLKLEPVDGWSPALAIDLAAIADSDGELAWYRNEVEARALGQWEVKVEGIRVGAVLWRVEDDGGVRTFVVVAAVAFHPSIDLLGSAWDAVEKFARGNYCAQIRMHTKRMGLVMRMRERGFGPAEWVLRKALV